MSCVLADQFTISDQQWMAAALKLAELGQGHVEPNPMVGCLLVKNEVEVGRGYHQHFGGPHAEVLALRSCESPSGSTAYVTLEPCCHYGKTPPCVNALIQAKVQRVVVAMLDPFGEVNGRGVKQLRDSGVVVEIGLMESEAHELNRPYIKRIETGMPWVIAKWAMSLDGKIATATGDSQWISNDQSREMVHELRGRMDAIMVGINTVLVDDPRLTARPAGPRTATRIVLDSRAQLPLTSKLVQSLEQAPVLVAVSKNANPSRCQALRNAGCEVWQSDVADPAEGLVRLLKYLGSRTMTNVWVEGGARLFGHLNDLRLIDEVHCFIAPGLIGGLESLSPIAGTGIATMSEHQRFDHIQVTRLGDDIYVRGRISR